jgi:hypothetical protein
MQGWTCYIINMPSGGLVTIQSSNQSVTSAFGWRKSIVNKQKFWGRAVDEEEARARETGKKAVEKRRNFQ